MFKDISEVETLFETKVNGHTPGCRISRVFVDGGKIVLRMTVATQKGGINVMMDDELVAKIRLALQQHEERQEDRRALFASMKSVEHRPIEKR